MNIAQILNTGDERELLRIWGSARSVQYVADRDQESCSSTRGSNRANQALTELPVLTALQALEVNRRLVDLLIARRWIVMRDARKEGASWEKIGQALGMSCQAAQGWYRRKIARREKYLARP